MTTSKLATERMRVSEMRYRRLFEAARDGILILNAKTLKITEVNPYMTELLGYSHDEFIGKELWEIGLFRDKAASIAAFRDLQRTGYLRYENLPLETTTGKRREVEFVSNVYDEDGIDVIQCNIRDITERKAYGAVRESLAAIVESSDDAIIGKDLYSIINTWNAAAERIFGYKSEEMVGNSIRLLIPPERTSEEDKILATIGRGDIVEHLETVRIRKDGTRIDVSLTTSPIKDGSGNVIGASKIARDITERKRFDGRFRRLVESNAQGVIFWNTKGEITEANDAFLDLVGYTRADLEARLIGWAAMTPPEYDHQDVLSLKELAAKGISTPIEKEFIRKDGSLVPILIGAALFEDSAEEGVSFVLDISESKKTQKALSESEEHFRFLNDLVVATRTLADAGQIMEVMSRMLGEHLQASRCAYADVDEDGERFTVLHDYTDGCTSTAGRYDHLSHFGSRATATLHGGQTLIVRNVDAEMLPDDGADMFSGIGIKAIITCPLVKEGKLRAFMAVHQTTPRDWKAAEISIVQDVVERCWATIERRTAEETIYKLNDELEQRVSERTAELAAANQELESFSYSVSHDLRAPLRHLNGFSLALLEDYSDKLDDVGKGYLQHVREASQEMGALIDDVLKLARVTRTEMHREQVDLSDLAADVIAKLREDAPERDVDIKIERGLVATGDKRLLHILLTNLLGNAWKFTSNVTAAEISFGAEKTESGQSYFVRDNGAGFDMAYANKLFGAFQRLHTTSEFEGTGIGLATVQRVINRHGGRVWAEGAVGSGATFYFTLSKELENER